MRAYHPIMTFRYFIAVLSAAALVALPAATATAAPAPDRSSLSVSRPLGPDADFLIAAHQANLTQVLAGKIALRKGTDPAVREFGRRFAAYHRRLDAAVREAARDLAVVLPKQPNSEQQTLVEQYRSTPAGEFDRLFLGSQLIAHERALKAARLVLDTGIEPAVKQIVTVAVPVVQEHHDALLAAQTKIGNTQRRQ